MILFRDITTPALILDRDKLDRNIAAMSRRARSLGVSLRPHVKTHKSPEIAGLQQTAGCQGLTVSTLHEARVFAQHGFDDLTWAYPVILDRLAEARELCEVATLRLVVDSEAAIARLEAFAYPFHVWLKVDCGYHRAGVDPTSSFASTLAQRLSESPRLAFDGLLTHSGQAYKARSVSELRRIAEEERRIMVGLAERLQAAGVAVPALSVGSTPAVSAAEQLEGVDEIRPGNYVFFDLMQSELGACSVGDCALSVLSSVISSQPGASHSVIDAGALALSKDTGLERRQPSTMGEVFADYEQGRLHPSLRVTSVSQEHGILSDPRPVGTQVRILPNHACLTVAHFDEYLVVQRGEVIDRWKIWRGRS